MTNNNLMKYCRSFGNWFENARYQTDYSVAEIASRMRVTVTTVYNWRRGKTMPGSWAQLEKVCKLLGADPEPIWEKFYR